MKKIIILALLLVWSSCMRERNNPLDAHYRYYQDNPDCTWDTCIIYDSAFVDVPGYKDTVIFEHEEINLLCK